MVNTQNLTSEEFESLFVDDSFKTRKRTKQNDHLYKMYDSVVISEMPKRGEIINAKYMGLYGESHILSVPGLKDDIRVDNRLSESKYLKNTELGEMIDVLISEINHNHFYIKGSISSLYESMARQNLKALEEGESVTVLVKSMNPAGYDIEIQHGGVTLPAFMPNTLAGINKLYNPDSIVGETFEVMIESYSENEGTYIVSRRKYLQSLIPNAVKELQYDMVYKGHVTGTTPFGVFVEFNDCLTGMIHKANLNPDWVDRISEIKPGFEIDFYIKEIIKNKIILTQIVRETLWDNIKNGQIIDGVVKDNKGFGTLVSLDEETVGLIHTSELEKIGKRFTKDQNLKVKVLSVDRGNRKIFLTIP
jgi:ribosomal protein S1